MFRRAEVWVSQRRLDHPPPELVRNGANHRFLTQGESTMLTRLQKSLKEKDQGFTLIELLVVIVIIGILAAIAIPLFLNQRQKGIDAGLKSDLKSAATTVETWIVDNPSTAVPTESAANAGGTTTPSSGAVVLSTLSVSEGNTVSLLPSATAGAYCIFAYNTAASTAKSATAQMAYVSLKGGLQKTIVTGTPACT
jgi:prepilin-type N-terminal cleavage/methylation domain-containing protein